MPSVRRSDLIEPELCYQIVGVLFAVFNELGPDHKETVYQKAVAKGLRSAGIEFTEQVHVPLTFQGERVGKYFLDFLIAHKLILELKSGTRYNPRNFKQVEGYLIAMSLPLAVLAHFGKDGVTFKRLINPRLVPKS